MSLTSFGPSIKFHSLTPTPAGKPVPAGARAHEIAPALRLRDVRQCYHVATASLTREVEIPETYLH